MSKFSELAGLPTTTHETGVVETTAPPAPPVPPVPPEPVVEAPVDVLPTHPAFENPLDQMPVANGQEPPRPEEEVADTISSPPVDLPELKYLSKIKLEEIGRSVGIELDRRLSQPKLVEQLEEHLANRG